MRRARGRGFTLIEALVALTLLALISGALMPLFQQGLAVLERVDRRTRAAMLALSLLEEHTLVVPGLEPGPVADAAGTDDGFTWQITREPYDAGADGGPPLEQEQVAFNLVRVSARVEWDGGGDGLRLSTLVMEQAQ